MKRVTSDHRALYAKLFVVVIFIIIALRISDLQLKDDSYANYSIRNSVRHITEYPSRGEIYDRNGVLIAHSTDSYNIMVTPKELLPFDTLAVARVLELPVEYIKEQVSKARKFSYRRASPIVSQVNKQKKLIIEEMNISGISFIMYPVRNYPYKSTGNIFGHLGEVTITDLQRDSYYQGGDYIGKTGIERVYEEYLRGEKGSRFKTVDVHGVVRSDYKAGADNIAPVMGHKLTSTIDIELQELGLRLMKGKIGAIVAIEPATGEVLAMITSPTFDPDSLVGMNMKLSYQSLSEDERRPLFNRAVMSGYPPGSTFKMANALILLKEGIVTPSTTFECNRGWSVPGRTVKCHRHRSPVNMEYAIQTSCNAYFCATFRRLLNSKKNGNIKQSFDVWSEDIKSFGFGQRYNSDIMGIQGGLVPTSKLYDRMYNNYWSDVSIISLSIGQGEITASPLQIANFMATIANRGYYYSPHIVREVEGENLPSLDEYKSIRHISNVDSMHYEPVIRGMWKAIYEDRDDDIDTYMIKGLNICGKSGTAQNSTGEDHSIYSAFAPKDNPKIAIAVYVEHGGWGNTYGKPIATMMIEQYLTDTIKRTDLLNRILNSTTEYPIYNKSND